MWTIWMLWNFRCIKKKMQTCAERVCWVGVWLHRCSFISLAWNRKKLKCSFLPDERLQIKVVPVWVCTVLLNRINTIKKNCLTLLSIHYLSFFFSNIKRAFFHNSNFNWPGFLLLLLLHTICEVSSETMERVSSWGHSRALETLVPPKMWRNDCVNSAVGGSDFVWCEFNYRLPGIANFRKRQVWNCNNIKACIIWQFTVSTGVKGHATHLHRVSNKHCVCRPAPQF